MKDLRFVEDTHQYFLTRDGREIELPALTNILKDVGIIDTRWYGPESANRGKAIHRALEYLDKDTLDWGTVDGQIYGWVEAYVNFKAEKKYELIDIEEPIYHKTCLYACTPDRLVVYRKKNIVIDFKSGAEELWHVLQLTMNAMAYQSHGTQIDELWGVYLKENGKHKVKKHEPEIDTCLAILKVYAWRNEKC